MNLRDSLQRVYRSHIQSQPGPRPKRRPRQLHLEALEERTLLTAHLTLAGAQTLVANTDVNVASSSNTTGTVESEMVVDVNPTNPLNVVGFTHNINNFNQIQVFYSFDGGNTWTRRLISNAASATSDTDGFGVVTKRFDPAIKFDANGNLFVAYGVDKTSTTSLVVGRSTNGGESFSQFTAVDFNFGTPDGNVVGGVDKWQLATGPQNNNPNNQVVFVAYTYNDYVNNRQRISVAGSNNGGVTFTSPVRIDDNSGNGDLFASPAVGPNGEVYVAWENLFSGTILFNRNVNFWGGGIFRGQTVAKALNQGLNGLIVPAQNSRGISSAPVLDVDRSGGPFNGRLYITYVDGFGSPTPAADVDIYLISSSNLGTSWTNINPGDPGNVEGAPSTDFLPWVAVDQDTGSVNVAYYTTDGAPDNTQVNLRLASSTDGGNTFSKTNVTSQRSRAASQTYGGDFLEYIGLAVRDGTAQAFWADNRDATQGTFVSDLHSYSASISTRNSGNQLRINGDGTLSLRSNPFNNAFADVIHNGVREWTGLWASLGSVTITTGNASDTVNIENTVSGVPVAVNLGNGTDTINICPTTHYLDGIQGNLTLTGGFGVDTLNVFDQSNPRNETYTMAATSVSRSFSALITYGISFNFVNINGGVGNDTYNVNGTSRQSTTLNTGSGNDTINIENTASPGSLAVNLGNGTDTINVSPAAHNLDKIQGALTLNGTGLGTLIVNDQGTTSAKVYEIYADTVQRVLNPDPITYDAVIHYANMGTLTVNGGRGGNVFFVEGTAAGTSTTVNGGSGGDEFWTSPSTNGPDSLFGPVTIHGRPGTNSYLVYYDYFATILQNYTLTANTVNRSAAAPVSFDGLNQLVLYPAQVGGNTVDVQSLDAGVFDNLVAFSGDTFTIGSNQTLAAILGPLRVETSDNASVTVAIDDSGNLTQPAGPIAFSNSPGVGYQISGLVPQAIYLLAGQNSTLTTSLLTGAGDKTFTMQDAPQGVALTLDAGSGTNTLDYTGYTGNVLVDLPLGTATGFSGISHIRNVQGASGGALGNYNILVGNGGNVLTGGSGRRNLLIAGGSASQLFGGNDDDILIGGTTAYDTEADMASLQAIMAYWTAADDYATRVNNLTTGNGVPLLDATMVLSNGAGNTLQGSGGLDLFFGSLGLDNHDKQDGEVFIEV